MTRAPAALPLSYWSCLQTGVEPATNRSHNPNHPARRREPKLNCGELCRRELQTINRSVCCDQKIRRDGLAVDKIATNKWSSMV